MNSDGFSSDKCARVVSNLYALFLNNEACVDISSINEIDQLQYSCQREWDAENNDKFSEPMLWIGIYIAIASFICILAMAADLLHGFRNKKFWFPCKYFSLNAASITVIAVAMKLPVDLNSEMPDSIDQATKLGSLGFMCTMMANLMPSLASMDNKTLLANITGFCILVITVIVNVYIQMYTGVISYEFAMGPRIYTCMIILLLIMMISSSLTIPTSKEILESKYQTKNNISLTDQHSLQHIQMSTIEKLRQQVRRYWVMAETGSPQFVMASTPLSTASAMTCVMVLVINFKVSTVYLLPYKIKYEGGSPYKWSTYFILLMQSIGIVVGGIAPIFRCFSVFNFKLGTKWNRNYFMFFKVEKYWIQKLQQWKQSPVLFLSSNRTSRSLIYNSKNITLSFCIGFQTLIVISCKVTRLVASLIVVIYFAILLVVSCFYSLIPPLFVVSCFYCLKSLKARWFTPPLPSRTDDIDDDLRNYVLQIDNEMELSEKILKRISNSMNDFILKTSKEENIYLLELLDKFTGFKGVEIFDTDDFQPVLSIKLVNSWSMPIVTLTCIAVALPNISKDAVEKLFKSVGEGLSYAHLVEESLNTASEYANIQKTALILWHELEHKCKWLDNPLAKNVIKGKPAMEIVEWISDKAKQILEEIKESSNGELVENPSHSLIAANSMYRITQTVLLRYKSKIEPITKKQLFAHLSAMIADIFCACFTNIPRVITMRCHESMIERREASVKVAAKLLGKTTKIIEKLETIEVPSMDEEKMAYIDEWRLYLRQSVP